MKIGRSQIDVDVDKYEFHYWEIVVEQPKCKQAVFHGIPFLRVL